MSAPQLVQAAGAFSTRRFVIPAGGEAQFDCDAVQLLITELDNAAELQLQLNHGQTGRAWKGFEATGRIVYVRAENTAADSITVEFLTVSPGLVVRDRRLNQVGDLGLVTAYAIFQPVGIVQIPGQSVRLVAEADPDRRYTLLSNPPGQLREIYISGAEVDNLGEITFGDPGFEDTRSTGSGNPWSNVIDPPHAGGGNWVSGFAGGAVITAPHGGAGMLWQDDNLGQTTTSQTSSDLVSAQGFDALLIDSEQLTYRASVWAASEDTDSMDLQLTWRDAGALTIRVDLLDNAPVAAFAGAGWQEMVLEGVIPAGTRSVVVLLRENGGSVEKAFDDFQLLVNGSPPDLSEMAGFIMPAGDKLLPASSAIYAYNPHSTPQDLMVGEIRAS